MIDQDPEDEVIFPAVTVQIPPGSADAPAGTLRVPLAMDRIAIDVSEPVGRLRVGSPCASRPLPRVRVPVTGDKIVTTADAPGVVVFTMS